MGLQFDFAHSLGRDVNLDGIVAIRNKPWQAHIGRSRETV